MSAALALVAGTGLLAHATSHAQATGYTRDLAAAPLTAGQWYRIASTPASGPRADADFVICDTHNQIGSSMVLNVGLGSMAGSGTLLDRSPSLVAVSHAGGSRYFIEQARLVHDTTGNQVFLEIFLRDWSIALNNGKAYFSINNFNENTTGENRWTAVDWAAGAVPSSGETKVFALAKDAKPAVFAVAGTRSAAEAGTATQTPGLTVLRDGQVIVTGILRVPALGGIPMANFQ